MITEKDVDELLVIIVSAGKLNEPAVGPEVVEKFTVTGDVSVLLT